jgi:6-phosphogluconate dehydrogenase
VKDFVEGMAAPRKVVILVQAGKPVDDTISALAEFLQVN